MTELQPQPINWATSFRKAMTTSKEQQIVGIPEKVTVYPIDQNRLSNLIDIPCDRTSLTSTEFYDLSLKALGYATQNTVLYSGITAENFYKANNKDISVAKKSTEEFAEILDIIVSGNTQELNLPNPVTEFLSEIKKQPSAYDIRRGVERGILTAKQCENCEQVDPIIGAQFHIASAIMNRLYSESTLTKFWNETYKDSPTEINNPQTVGLEDLIIITVRDNQEKFPTLDKFFGSLVELGEKKMTYYDMVDTLIYQTQ